MPAAVRDAAVGLSTSAAAEQLRRDGPNRLPPPRRPTALRRFAEQLIHFFALLLWCASGLALIAGLPQLAVAIALVVTVNAVFAFVQERRADHAAERLRSLLPQRITVIRDGQRVRIDADGVVRGDMLLLDAGDRIPADATVVRAHGLLVDTSTFTGESEPSATTDGQRLLAGTFVVEGEAEAIVDATGSGTRLAEVVRLTVLTPSPPSPLALELRHVVRTIAIIAVSVGVVFFGVTLLVGNPADDGFVFAIGVTVALVPEALLPTVTLSLAWGAEQLAKRNVLVRELEAVETLGSTTFICTDKTGTLTRNQMTVVEAWTRRGTIVVDTPGYDPDASMQLAGDEARDAITALALQAVRCSNGFVRHDGGRWVPHGDPMEAAIDVFARRLGVDTDADRATMATTARFPFDPRRRRMTVVTDQEVITKGAPDALFDHCAETASAAGVLDAWTSRGLRVLAIGARPAHGDAPLDADDAERDLVLVGLLALEDPPRDDVASAITRCRGAGIKVAMITGDHPATAAAIADEVSLRMEGSPIVVGDDLPADDAALGRLVDHDGIVLARISPEDKLRIARALRARGHVVAMTGDGVNDGPALHEADIGIAMGESGTDVAREAADLVLLDDHFASIVAAVEVGRATFVNMRRFLTYHLTDNVAEVTPFLLWALSGGSFPLALGVMQVLALDIGTDTLSAVALGAEPPTPGALDGPPVRGRLLDRLVVRRAFAVLGPTVTAFAMAAFLLTHVASGWRPGDSFSTGSIAAAASGATFMTIVLAQTANAFACRSTSRWPGAIGWTTNHLLIPAASIELLVSLTVLLVPPIASQLDHVAPTAVGWLVALASMPALLAVDALDKRRRRR